MSVASSLRFSLAISMVVLLFGVSLLSPPVFSGQIWKESAPTFPIKVNGLHLDLKFYSSKRPEFTFESTTFSRTIGLSSIGTNLDTISLISSERRLAIKPLFFTINSTKNVESTAKSSILNKKVTKEALFSMESASSTGFVLRKKGFYRIEYVSTLTGLKENIILERRPTNLTSDLTFRSVLFYDDEHIRIKTEEENNKAYRPPSRMTSWTTAEGDIVFYSKNNKEIYRIHRPTLEVKPPVSKSIMGRTFSQKANNKIELGHRYLMGKGCIYYEVVIPKALLYSPHLKYPLLIDPELSTDGGDVTYEGYDNGSIKVESGEEVKWYHNVSRTVFLESNLTIGPGENLTLKNIILKVNNTNIGIIVENGGAFNLLGDSVATISEHSKSYFVLYKQGSRGTIDFSTVEYMNHSPGLEIRSSMVRLSASTFRYNGPIALYINQSSPTITGCTFYNNTPNTIIISEFSSPYFKGNTIQNTSTGVKWLDTTIYEDYESEENIEKMVGVEMSKGEIKYVDEVNLAPIMATVSTDSEWYTGEYPGNKMCDGIKGKIHNIWSSHWTAEPHWAVFEFDDPINVTRFVIYHRPDYPTCDFRIQIWRNNNWENLFIVDDNEKAVTYHNLTQPVSSTKYRLYITDANANLDSVARIEEFEIYGNITGKDYHYVLSKPIEIQGNYRFKEIRVKKYEPSGANIYITIVDADTDETIPGFSEMTMETINLMNIDPIKYSKIKIKAEFSKGTGEGPVLNGWLLSYSPLRAVGDDFYDNGLTEQLNNTVINNGRATVEYEYIFEENWGDGWNTRWTIDKRYDEGYAETGLNHWYDSGYDLYCEGTSNQSKEDHDGWVSVYKRFYNISKENVLSTRFYGKIDGSIYNYADVLITLYDTNFTEYKRIRWTTRDYSFDGGLHGDVYYIVAQENDSTEPYEYNTLIFSSIEGLFEKYFGKNTINWSKYKNLEFRVYSIENYQSWAHQNPQVYVDYFNLLDKMPENGSLVTKPFTIPEDTEWVTLNVEKVERNASYISVSVINAINHKPIDGLTNLTESAIDLGVLNDKYIRSIKLLFNFHQKGSDYLALEGYKIYSSIAFSENVFENNTISLSLYQTMSPLFANIIKNSAQIGLYVYGASSYNEFSDIKYNLGSKNSFVKNNISVMVENSSIIMSDFRFTDSKQSLFIRNSSIEMQSTLFLSDNGSKSVFNASLKAVKSEYIYSRYYYRFFSSYGLFIDVYGIGGMNDDKILLENSTVEYYNTLSEDIKRIFQDNKSLVKVWWSGDIICSQAKPSIHLLIKDNKNNTIINRQIYDDNKFTNIFLQEYESNISGRKFYTPFTIEITNNGYRTSLESEIHYRYKWTFCPYQDSDQDGVNDLSEMYCGHWFRGVDLISNYEQLVSESEIILGRIYNTKTMINKTIGNFTPGTYKIYILAYTDDGNGNFTLVVYNESTSLMTQSFFIDETPRWTSTKFFNYPGGHMRVKIFKNTNELLDRTIYLSYLVLVDKKDINATAYPTNPLDPDTDKDGLLDGEEMTAPYLYTLEGEELVFSETQILRDYIASNRSIIQAASNNHTFFDRNMKLEKGDYVAFIKARTNGNMANLSLYLNNTPPVYLNFNSKHWNWYRIGNVSSDNGEVRMKIVENSNCDVRIDKIMFKKIVKDDEWYGRYSNNKNQVSSSKGFSEHELWRTYVGSKNASAPMIYNGKMYLLTFNGELICIDEETGRVIKRIDIPGVGDVSYVYTPIKGGEYILVPLDDGTMTVVYCFYLSNLTLKYEVGLNGKIYTSSIITSFNTFFYGTTDGKIEARCIANGSLKWSIQLMGGEVYTPTISSDLDTLYVGTDAEYIYALSNIYGWGSNTVGITGHSIEYMISTPLVGTYDDWYLFGTKDGRIMKIRFVGSTYNLETVAVIEGESFSSPVVLCEEGFAIIGGTKGRVCAVDPFSNLFLWESSSENKFINYSWYVPVVTDDAIYVILEGRNRINILDKYSGTTRKAYEISLVDKIRRVVGVGRKLYILDESGFLYAFGSEDTDPLDIDQDSDMARDGIETNTFQRIYLIEAEDYEHGEAVRTNAKNITLYTTIDKSRINVGYAKANSTSLVSYSINISDEGFYLVEIRLVPRFLFKQMYGPNNSMESEALFYAKSEGIIKEMLNRCLNITIDSGGIGDMALAEDHPWEYVHFGGGKEVEGLSGGGYFARSLFCYFMPGTYNLTIIDNVFNENGTVINVTVTDDEGYTYVYKLVGSRIAMDKFFIKRRGLSVINSDTDADNVLDGIELKERTFPLNPDPDKDGISDYYEINPPVREFETHGGIRFIINRTDPISRDTDGDGVRDRVEASYDYSDEYTIYDTTPSPASQFERRVRKLSGDNPVVSNNDEDTYCTNPCSLDTDGDGLPDGVYDGVVYVPMYARIGPYGLEGMDTWEFSTERYNEIIEFWEGEDYDLNGAVNDSSWYYNQTSFEPWGGESDPGIPDSDGDGMYDGWEVWHSLSPVEEEGLNGPEGDSDYVSYESPWKHSFSHLPDHVSNIEEYYIGTSPSDSDTDNDGINDSVELKMERGMGEIAYYLKTTIREGGLWGEYYGATKSNEYIRFVSKEKTYHYYKTIILSGEEYKWNYPCNLSSDGDENIELAELYDGTRIVYNKTVDEIYVLVGISHCTDNDGDGYRDMKCVVYTITTETPTFPTGRYYHIYRSDPLCNDTDGDGLKDSDEDWEGMGYNNYYYLGDVDSDDVPNVRDEDSDNDLVRDGDEVTYYVTYSSNGAATKIESVDSDSDGKPNVIDDDSDDDGIKDGYEYILNGVTHYDADLDRDGYACMVDVDSDGDGLPDGWIDGYVYDSSRSIHLGGYYRIENWDGHRDSWEGEDLDCSNNISGDDNGNRWLDENETFMETDPYRPDTDHDGLIDGYTSINERTIIYYFRGYQLINMGEYNITNGETHCNPLDNDTDDDGLIDGLEVSGWYFSYRDMDGNEIAMKGYSSPLQSDTDGDGLDDGDEYRYTDGSKTDTDGDGIEDGEEVNLGLDPTNQDTDGDHLPDGWIDMNGDNAAQWGEYERIDNTNYTDPKDPDTDDDGIEDGIEAAYMVFRTNAKSGEYYHEGVWIYLEPGIGEYRVMWYRRNLTWDQLNGTGANLSHMLKLPYKTYDGLEIYLSLMSPFGVETKTPNGTNISYVLIRDSENNMFYQFLPEDKYFEWLNYSGSWGSFMLKYRAPYKVPYKSLKYHDRETVIYLSKPYDNDTDDDGLTDGEEFYHLCRGNSYLVLKDFDEDGLGTLRDSDSDGDRIIDMNDLWRYTNVNNSKKNVTYEEDPYNWSQAYYVDYDGDGLPNALDRDSDGDGRYDDEEDKNNKSDSLSYNGFYNKNDTSNPLDTDTDHDGIRDNIEVKYGLSPTDPDTDDDGILDGLEGGGKFWLDVDNDGKISAKDTDSDGDGIEDSDEDKNCNGFLDENETDAWDPDTDGDGLWDGENVTVKAKTRLRYYVVEGKVSSFYEKTDGTALMVGEKSVGTDPLNPDSDNDRIADGVEYLGYAEFGVLLNEFYVMRGGLHESEIKFPIMLPGRYVLAVYFKDCGVNGLTLKVRNVSGVKIYQDTVYHVNEINVFDMGYFGEAGEYTAEFYPLSIPKMYLLKEGLDPLCNDTDGDGLKDGDEVFGDTGYVTHPLSADSDADYISDKDELRYGMMIYGQERVVELNPVDPDTDGDMILDGLDREPTVVYRGIRWEYRMPPYYLDGKMEFEYVYAVKKSDGAFNSKGVRGGKLSQEWGEKWANKFLTGRYTGGKFKDMMIVGYGTISEPEEIRDYKYDSGNLDLGSSAKNTKLKHFEITYGIKAQRIVVKYTNTREISDNNRHGKMFVEFGEESNYDVVVEVAVDSDDLTWDEYGYPTTKLYAISKVYSVGYSEGGWRGRGYYFSGMPLHTVEAKLNYIGRSQYYNKMVIYDFLLNIPKDVVGKGYENNGKRMLALDIILVSESVEGEERALNNLDGEIVVGAITKERVNTTYYLLVRRDTDVSSVILMEEIKRTYGDVGKIGKSRAIYININDRTVSVYVANLVENNDNSVMGNIKNIADSTKPVGGLLIIGKNQSEIDEVLNKFKWSSDWSAKGGIKSGHYSLNNISVKNYQEEERDVWTGGNDYALMGLSMRVTRDVIKPGKALYEGRMSWVKRHPYYQPNFKGFVEGDSGLLSIYEKESNIIVVGKGAREYVRRSCSISDAIAEEDLDAFYHKLELFESDAFYYYKMKSALSVGSALAESGADLVEIVSDFQTLITLSANMTGHNKVKAVVCVADIAMRSVRIGRNAYSVYKETKYVDNIMDLKKVVRASGPDPVSMLLDAAIAAATITLLVLDAMDASNLIVQRALYEAAVQTGIGACIDIAMGVLVFAFPIGTAIVVGYYVAVLVLDIMKWSFGIDIKKEVWENFINLFGYATHEQENTALKNVCDVMDDIVEERREGYNNQDGIPIICVPLYPDPTK